MKISMFMIAAVAVAALSAVAVAGPTRSCCDGREGGAAQNPILQAARNVAGS